MTILSQSRPDAISLRASKARSQKVCTLWDLAFLTVILLVLAMVLVPVSSNCHGSPLRNEAVNDARQIGIALFEFQTKFGKFPDATTIAASRKSSDAASLLLGTKTSNDFFRQLVTSGIVTNESIFYAKIEGSRKPDGKMDGADLLAKGECGFTYFMGATEGDNPNRPLIVAPMIPGTDRFDPKPFDGKVVILKMDNSVSAYPIRLSDGHVFVEGKNLMDPSNPIWQGHPPTIAWPDL